MSSARTPRASSGGNQKLNEIPPPTTVHQLCREIGEIAMETMLERIVTSKLLTRDVLLARATAQLLDRFLMRKPNLSF